MWFIRLKIGIIFHDCSEQLQLKKFFFIFGSIKLPNLKNLKSEFNAYEKIFSSRQIFREVKSRLFNVIQFRQKDQ